MNAMDKNNKEPVPEIDMAIDKSTLPLLFQLLNQGVNLKVPSGVSLRDALSNYLGITPDYLKNRIQTIFLNGHPVDDEESVRLTQGDVLALSAAMPGLAGATLRKGGALAAMRSSISHTEKSQADQEEPCTITIKLFNLVARELGPKLLARGILVSFRSFRELAAVHGKLLEAAAEDSVFERLSAREQANGTARIVLRVTVRP